MKILSAIACCLLAFIVLPLHGKEHLGSSLSIERTITDVSGRSIDVTILEDDGISLRIRRKSDSKEFIIALERLSQKDRDWLDAARVKKAQGKSAAQREDDEANKAKPAPKNKPEPKRRTPTAPESKPTPAPEKQWPRLISSRDIVATLEKQGLVLPPPGWDALRTSIRFKDGKKVDGYVYNVVDGRFWYAQLDMIQKGGSLDDLVPLSRAELELWRNRAPFHLRSPSVELSVNDEKLYASIMQADEEQVTLFTEKGELMNDVPVSQLDARSQKFVNEWTSGTWKPESEDWVIPPDEFTQVRPFFDNGRALAMRDKKWGLIDTTGTFVEAPRFDRIVEIGDSGNLKVLENGKWGLMLDGGRIAVPPEWEDVGDLHSGMVRVKKNGKWGYIADGGELIVPCTWDYAEKFSPVGTAMVTRLGKRRLGKYGFVDREGTLIVEPEWDDAIMHTPHGMGAVKRNRRWTLIDQNGKLLGDWKWRFWWRDRHFDYGYILAWSVDQSEEDKILLGMDGKPIEKPRLRAKFVPAKQPGPFIGIESLSTTFSMDDRSGQSLELEEFRDLGGGFAAVRQGDKWGLADRNGVVIKPKWDKIGRFYQGLVAVVDHGQDAQWKFINTAGETVIEAHPDRHYVLDQSQTPLAPVFRHGRVETKKLIKRSSTTHWIDDHGHELPEISLAEAPPGLPHPKPAGKDRLLGLMDTDGKIQMEPEWERLRVISPEVLWLGHDLITTIEGKTITEKETGISSVLAMDGESAFKINVIGRRSEIRWMDGSLVLPEEHADLKLERVHNKDLIFRGDKNKAGTWWVADHKLQRLEPFSSASGKIPRRHLRIRGMHANHLILREGRSNKPPEAWWRANIEDRSMHRYEDVSRVYWNLSLEKYGRIWLKNKTSGRWQFCTIEGQHLGPEMTETPKKWFLDEGYGVIREGESSHFIDRDGNPFGPRSLDDARVFQHGLAAAKKDGLWGFIDHTGKFKIPPQFDEVGDYIAAARKGAKEQPLLAAVKIDDKWGYMDPAGKMVIPLVGEARGIWDPRKNLIYFPSKENRWNRMAEYDARGNLLKKHSQRSSRARRKNPLAGEWVMFRGENRQLGLKNAAGEVVLEPRWIDLTWVGQGVLACQGKHDGGLFSPEKGWIFRDNDQLRIARKEPGYRGRVRLELDGASNGLIHIEKTPKWGYTRYSNIEGKESDITKSWLEDLPDKEKFLADVEHFAAIFRQTNAQKRYADRLQSRVDDVHNGKQDSFYSLAKRIVNGNITHGNPKGCPDAFKALLLALNENEKNGLKVINRMFQIGYPIHRKNQYELIKYVSFHAKRGEYSAMMTMARISVYNKNIDFNIKEDLIENEQIDFSLEAGIKLLNSVKSTDPDEAQSYEIERTLAWAYKENRDYEKSFPIFKILAEDGKWEMVEYARSLHYGRGCKPDLEAAVHWYEKSLEKGYNWIKNDYHKAKQAIKSAE